jgi:hypothetical protein
MYVVTNAKDGRDSYAADRLEVAFEDANFNKGTQVHIYKTECKDAGLARLGLGGKHSYIKTIVVK